jgi:cation transport ATPase
MSNIRQKLFFAFIYSAAGVPIAAERRQLGRVAIGLAGGVRSIRAGG